MKTGKIRTKRKSPVWGYRALGRVGLGKSNPFLMAVLNLKWYNKDIENAKRRVFSALGVGYSKKGISSMSEESIPQNRICNKCGMKYPLTPAYWHRSKSSEHGLNTICKICRNRHHANNRASDGGARNRAYFHANKDRLKEYQKEYRKTKKRKQAKYEYQRRRLFRLINLPGDYLETDWQATLLYFNQSCAICGCTPDNKSDLALDHWIPIFEHDCLGTVVNNIVPLCNICNAQKGSSLPIVWLRRYYNQDEIDTILRKINSYFEWALNRKYGKNREQIS